MARKKMSPYQSLELKPSWEEGSKSANLTMPRWEPNVLVSGGLRPTDVVCGRGQTATAHTGNVNYRRIVIQLQETYNKVPKTEKHLIAQQVIRAVQRCDPPGRFLIPSDEGNGYLTVHPKRAIEKTLQALRETKWNNYKNKDPNRIRPPQPPSLAAAAAAAAAATTGSSQLAHQQPTLPSQKSTKKMQISQVKVGTRIGVWWEEDEVYYPAVCTMRRDEEHSNKKNWLILYDDGEREWIDLREHTFRILNDKGIKRDRTPVANNKRLHKKPKLTRNKSHEEKGEGIDDEAPPKSYLLYPQPSFLFRETSVLAVCSEFLGLGEFANASLKQVEKGDGSFEAYLKRKRRGNAAYEHYPKLAIVKELVELAREKIAADGSSELRQVLEQFDKVRTQEKDRYDFWAFCRVFVNNKGQMPPPPPLPPVVTPVAQSQIPQRATQPFQLQHPLFQSHCPGVGGGLSSISREHKRMTPRESSTSGFSYLNAPSAPSNDSQSISAMISHRLLEASSSDGDSNNDKDIATEGSNFDNFNNSHDDSQDDYDYDDYRALREAREQYELQVAARKENLKILELEAEMKELEETSERTSSSPSTQPIATSGDNDEVVNNSGDMIHTVRAVIMVTGLLLKSYRSFALLTTFTIGGAGILKKLLAPYDNAAWWPSDKKKSLRQMHPPSTATALESKECLYKDLSYVLVTIALQVMKAPDSYLAVVASVACFGTLLTCTSHLLLSLRDNIGGKDTLSMYGCISIIVVTFLGCAISLGDIQETIHNR